MEGLQSELEHPMLSGGFTSAARSPALAGCLICIGTRWGRANVDWATRRLEHRGPPLTLEESEDFVVQGFQEKLRETARNGSRIWTMGLDREEHDAAVQLSLEGRLCESGPQRLLFGTVIHFDQERGQLEVSRGELHVPAFYFAQDGGSLFIAPEIKAFSDVRRMKDIAPIPRGSVFRFDSATGRVRVEARASIWPEVQRTGLAYETCKTELRRLLAEGMAQALAQCEGEPVIALSGGLDSGIVAYLACEAGRRLRAYTVFFDRGDGSISPDLEGARMTARELGLDLVEVRVGPGDLEALVREVIFVSEEPNWRDIETGVFVQQLSRTLRERGVRTILMGIKADSLFVSHYDPSDPGTEFEQYRDEFVRRHITTGMQTQIPPVFGQRVCSPFMHEPLIQFVRRMPEEYLVDGTKRGHQGKKILRETYGHLFESPIVHDEKRYPLDTMGFAEIFKERWGWRRQRQKRYDRMRRGLLRPVQLKKGWAWPWGK